MTIRYTKPVVLLDKHNLIMFVTTGRAVAGNVFPIMVGGKHLPK